MVEPDRTHLPIRRPPFAGVANRTLDGSQPDWNLIGHPTAPAGAPNVLLVLDRRRRVRQPEHVRRSDPDAELHAHGRGGPALQPLPRDGALLADPRGAADRAQQPRRRVRLDRRVRGRLPGLLGDACRATARRCRGSCATTATRTAAFGKWHLTPDGQQGPRGRSTAGRTAGGSTTSTGILGGGSSQWDPCLAENQKIIGTAEEFYDEEDPYYFPDAMADKTIEWLHGVRAQDAHEAVLRLLLDRVQPRAAPRREGVGRQVQGEVRPGLGQAPRGDLRPAEGARRDPCRRGAHPARRRVPRMGRRARQAEAVLRAADGGLRRATRRTPTTTSAA